LTAVNVGPECGRLRPTSKARRRPGRKTVEKVALAVLTEPSAERRGGKPPAKIASRFVAAVS
jgi:hypothetical protein